MTIIIMEICIIILVLKMFILEGVLILTRVKKIFIYLLLLIIAILIVAMVSKWMKTKGKLLLKKYFLKQDKKFNLKNT